MSLFALYDAGDSSSGEVASTTCRWPAQAFCADDRACPIGRSHTSKFSESPRCHNSDRCSAGLRNPGGGCRVLCWMLCVCAVQWMIEK